MLNVQSALEKADPADKAEIYAELGLCLTYQPDQKVVEVEASPACTSERVGGGT